MSSRPTFTSAVFVALFLLAGLAAAAEAGRLVERGAGELAARPCRMVPPTPAGPVWVQAGTGNVLSEFGPFFFATITDLGSGEGLSLYVVEGSPTLEQPDAPSIRFAYFDEAARLWRFDYQGITGEAAFVTVAGFSLVSIAPPAAARK